MAEKSEKANSPRQIDSQHRSISSQTTRLARLAEFKSAKKYTYKAKAGTGYLWKQEKLALSRGEGWDWPTYIFGVT